MGIRRVPILHVWIAGLLAIILNISGKGQTRLLESSDLQRLRSVTQVEISPDGKRIAYSVQNSDRAGRPYSQVWMLDVASGHSTRLGDGNGSSSDPRWSPDGQRIAYWGGGTRTAGPGEQESRPRLEPVVQHELLSGGASSLMVAQADGSGAISVASATGTNHDLPRADRSGVAWSPDGTKIAFLSSTPGPETEQASGDPRVITRYSYKPSASEGRTRFNDNRRLHIFIIDVASKHLRQLTDGTYYEHSIDWSPDGKEILFVSNREPDPDRVFNYGLFAVNVADGSIRQLIPGEAVKYRPKWSPDGKTIAYLGGRRGFHSSESFMEDAHVWLVNADGSNPRELGAVIDNRQNSPVWSRDNSAVYCTVQERGSVRLYRLPVSGAKPEWIVGGVGTVGSISVGPGDTVAYSLHTGQDLAELYLKAGAAPGKRMTDLNAAVLSGKSIAPVEALTFLSFDHEEVEAFLTQPLGRTAVSKHPMIVKIKGGPHGQQGPQFDLQAQVYAAQGWATLMVNYRGSTGYGQKFADAIFGKPGSNCGEPKDILFGVNAALTRNPWLDPDRLGIEGGSCGGQLSGWLITQTPIFRAAIPGYGIYNLVSFNYMSYYHDYMAVESGAFPHQDNLMDVYWEWSALKHAAQVKTPTMLVHGENDNDVPIAESEQFYIALKDSGVETIMVRYPREGHGISEPRHVVDLIDRSIAWYRKHFHAQKASGTGVKPAGGS